MARTPGKWYYREHPEWGDTWLVEDESGGTWIARVKSSEEDARLIAAAPDLVAACEVTLAHIKMDDNRWWHSAEEELLELAIAKARGE